MTWQLASVRQWYERGPPESDASLRAGRGWNAVSAGYATERVPPGLAATRPAHMFSEEDLRRSTAGLKTHGVRGTMTSHWKGQTTGGRGGAHWLDRDGVLASEGVLSTRLLDVTGYTPDIVQQGRPFKNRPACVEDGSWVRPSDSALLALEATKYAVVDTAAVSRQRAVSVRASHPEMYFGGGT